MVDLIHVRLSYLKCCASHNLHVDNLLPCAFPEKREESAGDIMGTCDVGSKD